MRFSTLGAIGVIASTLAATAVSAQELRVISGSGASAPADALIPGFEKAAGVRVKMEYMSGGSVRDRVMRGEIFDAGLIPTEALKPLLDANKLVVASKSNFADARLAFAVKKGAPKPNATSIELLQATLTNAKSFAYPDPKSGASIGIMFGKMIDQWAPSWGMAEDFEKKTLLTKSVTDVVAALKSGEAELGVLLTTQIAADPGIELASLLPEELRLSNLYVGYVMADAKQPELAAKFIAYLSTPAAAEVVRSKGFDPRR
jgi:molybdate transport system substrate-binding protein